MKPSVLQKYRKDNKLSRQAMADQFDVHRTTIFRWETGRAQIPIDKIRQVSKGTGISRAKLRPDVFAREGKSA